MSDDAIQFLRHCEKRQRRSNPVPPSLRGALAFLVIARSVSDEAIQFPRHCEERQRRSNPVPPSLRGALAFPVIARSVSVSRHCEERQRRSNPVLPSLRGASAFLVIARSVSDEAICELHARRHHGSTLSKQRYHQISWINSAVHQRLCNKKTMSFPGYYCQLMHLLIIRQLVC